MPPEMSTQVRGHQVSWYAPILHFYPYILPRKLRGWTGHVSQFCCKPVEPWPILEETSSSVGNFLPRLTFPCCHPFSTPEAFQGDSWGTNEIPFSAILLAECHHFCQPKELLFAATWKSQGVASNFPNHRRRWREIRSSKSNTFLSISGCYVVPMLETPCFLPMRFREWMVKRWNPETLKNLVGWLNDWGGCKWRHMTYDDLTARFSYKSMYYPNSSNRSWINSLLSQNIQVESQISSQGGIHKQNVPNSTIKKNRAISSKWQGMLNQRCSNGHIKLEGIIIKSMTRHQETPG